MASKRNPILLLIESSSESSRGIISLLTHVWNASKRSVMSSLTDARKFSIWVANWFCSSLLSARICVAIWELTFVTISSLTDFSKVASYVSSHLTAFSSRGEGFEVEFHRQGHEERKHHAIDSMAGW